MARRLLVSLVLGLGIGTVVTGCSDSDPNPNARGAPVQVYSYTVRGKIEQLPEAGKPAAALQIHHEAIPDFIRADGGRGMGSMIMPFRPGNGVSLEGLGVGDVVEFVWEVRRGGKTEAFIRSIRKLPDGTPLNLGSSSGG
jgi:hypothetical protein